jgi:hypothetical protein
LHHLTHLPWRAPCLLPGLALAGFVLCEHHRVGPMSPSHAPRTLHVTEACVCIRQRESTLGAGLPVLAAPVRHLPRLARQPGLYQQQSQRQGRPVGDGHDELEDLTVDWTRLGLDL